MSIIANFAPQTYPKLSVTTVKKWIRNYEIPIREEKPKNPILPIPAKNILKEWFISKKYSLNKIAKLLRTEDPVSYQKLSAKTVKMWLTNYNLFSY